MNATDTWVSPIIDCGTPWGNLMPLGRRRDMSARNYSRVKTDERKGGDQGLDQARASEIVWHWCNNFQSGINGNAI